MPANQCRRRYLASRSQRQIRQLSWRSIRLWRHRPAGLCRSSGQALAPGLCGHPVVPEGFLGALGTGGADALVDRECPL